MGKYGNADDVIDLIAASLVPGRPDVTRHLFNAVGARAPDVVWSPNDAELRNPLLRQFAEICSKYHDENGNISANAIRLEDFGGLTDWIMLIDVLDQGQDFRYTFYGPEIADYYGQDMTGQRTSEFGGHISTFFGGLYKAIMRRGETAYSEHEPPQNVFVRVWQRLIIPLVDENDSVIRFIALNVPENELRTGLEFMVDPVMVLTDSRKIVYTNRAAMVLFSMTRPPRGAQFEEVTDIGFETELSLTEMLSQHRVDDTVQLVVRGAMVERLVMTVSAAQHRNAAFYVVVLRIIGS